MYKKSFFFVIIFFLFSGLVYFTPSAWFIYFPKEYVYFLSIFCSLLQFFVVYRIKANRNIPKVIQMQEYGIWILLFLSFVSMIFFPVRNLNLGDGVLLLEHVALESKIFGYHLTMDEILEAFIHSILYTQFQTFFSNPMQVYRLVSTIFGFVSLSILVYFFRKFQISFIGYFFVLLSGGMYLFYGYSENYTIITSVLWFYILFVIQKIKENKERNLQVLIPVSVIACSLILLHLVSGYLILSLIFLCFHFSDKDKFVRNAIISTLVSILILSPVFLYFTFFSEVRFDFTQTHLTNPKFYPLKKMISINHFRDILFCIIGSAFLPFVFIIYNMSFNWTELKKVFLKREIQFILYVLVGFSIHGFVHYPQLGFPADWDLLAFYWTPISFLGVFIWKEMHQISKENNNESRINISYELIPILLFSGSIFVINFLFLSHLDLNSMKILETSLNRIEKFSELEDTKKIETVKPSHKKFYLKVSFFLYESFDKLTNINPNEDIARLMKENRQFKIELEQNINLVESKWQKDFYRRMTDYHIEYLKLLQEK